MNTLLNFTKIGIIERQAFSVQCIFDNYILAAIEAYDVEGSVKRRAQSFITGLAPLWKIYRKEAYVPLFNNFIDMEIGLEVLSERHSAHVNHVIQEFLFGYNILVLLRQFIACFKGEHVIISGHGYRNHMSWH